MTPSPAPPGRKISLGLAGSALVFAAMRFYRIGVYPLWSDEVFTMGIVRRPWARLLPAVALDVVHPPLYYAVLKVWTAMGGAGGEGLVWLRLLSVLTTIAALVPFVLLCRELRLSDAVAAVALLLAAPNAFLLEYSQQVRMYAPLLLFTVCSLWLFARLERCPPDGVAACARWLTAVNLLLVYSQYYGWVVVGLEILYLLLFRRGRLGPMLLSTVVVAIAFAPWAIRVAAEARALGGLAPNLGWMRRPGVRDVAAFFASLNGLCREGARLAPARALAGLLLFGIPVLLFLLSALRRRTGRGAGNGGRATAEPGVARWLAFFAFGPVAVSLIASRALPVSVFEARHMLIAIVPYYLLCAAAAFALHPPVLRTAGAALMVVWAWLGGVERLPNRDTVSWGTLVERMVESRECGELPPGEETFYVIGRANMIPIEYYWKREVRRPVTIRLIVDPSGLPREPAWLAYQESLWGGWTSARIRSLLSEEGRRVTCDFDSGLAEHRGHLLRVVLDDSASAR